LRIVLDLRLLHQAVTLARFRNYARAAQALHLTQPALSRSIAGLEARLGERLFNRTQRGVEPTAFGALLLARGQALLEEAAGLEREFTAMRGLDIGELSVGAGAYPAQMSVGRAVGRLVGEHPGLRIEVMSDDVRVIVDALLSGKIALAVIELSVVAGEPRLASEPLPAHPACFYCRAGHPLAAEAAPAIERIMQFPYAGTRMPPRVAQAFLALAKAGSIDRDTGDYVPPIRVDSVPMVKDVVLASDAVATAPLAFIADDVARGRLVALSARAPWMQTGYGFVHLRGATLSPAALAFKEAVWDEERRIAAEEARAAARPPPSSASRSRRANSRQERERSLP
jgi:DNA-binding transcriptional LysR family regulator